MADRSMESSERLRDFAAALRPRLRGELRLDQLSRSLYATDASMYQVEPLGVLVPRDRSDVTAAIEEAASFELPVLPRGSGSSLAGSAVGGALVIDTSRYLDRVVGFDRERRTVTVEPGVVLDHLNAWLAGGPPAGPGADASGDSGLRFGPDPASSNRATLGGMVGTNATGTRSIRYGSVVDHVVSAHAVLPDGTEVSLQPRDRESWQATARRPGPEGDLHRALERLLARSGDVVRRDTPRHWRRAGGYRLERLLDADSRNVAHLVCGSEGTLAFLTEVTLRLVDRPRRNALGVAHFPSRRAALEAVEPILATDPSAVELFDRIALERAREVVEYRPRLGFVQGDPGALLIVEYDGETETEVRARLDELSRALGPSGTVTRCETDARIRDVWAVRKAGLGLAMSARLPVQCLAFIEDAAVPVEHLPAYVARLETVLRENDTDAVVYAHASAGCLHVRPFLDTREGEGVRRMEAIARASAELVKEYGGIVSSEHGDGLARSWLAPEFYGHPLYESYREVKRIFDPEGRFNPGRVVEAPPMTENLRSQRPLQVLPVATRMDWSSIGGLARAVEACNGQGVCRKRLDGTMCPSFMVTREERDSTRGRANALRNVLSGSLPADALTGPEMKEVMDLCVSCKACRAECPAAVDMAAMKAEWQATVWDTERPPLRTRLIARQPEVARRMAGPLAPVANAAMGSAPGRWVLRRLGFASGRRLPPFARHPFRSEDADGTPQHARDLVEADGTPEDAPDPVEADGTPEHAPDPVHADATSRHARDHVVLYADTFARFHEPDIPRAAVRVLRAAGYRVTVPPYRCCGRTLISKGFLEAARARVASLVDTLHPFAERGVPIVGLEPSCLLTLRDEAERLLPDDRRAGVVARAATTFEEFVAERSDRFEPLFRDRPSRRAYLHGHCHQKALSGTEPGVRCLRAAGIETTVLDAGCCGMAGSFGYEAEHESISRAMAERVLAPTVREAPEDVLLAAAGTSCRHQIADCAGRTARHPAEHLADRLREPPPTA